MDELTQFGELLSKLGWPAVLFLLFYKSPSYTVAVLRLRQARHVISFMTLNTQLYKITKTPQIPTRYVRPVNYFIVPTLRTLFCFPFSSYNPRMKTGILYVCSFPVSAIFIRKMRQLHAFIPTRLSAFIFEITYFRTIITYLYKVNWFYYFIITKRALLFNILASCIRLLSFSGFVITFFRATFSFPNLYSTLICVKYFSTHNTFSFKHSLKTKSASYSLNYHEKTIQRAFSVIVDNNFMVA